MRAALQREDGDVKSPLQADDGHGKSGNCGAKKSGGKVPAKSGDGKMPG